MTGRRTRNATDAYVAEPAQVKRRSRFLGLHKSRFSEEWWQCHLNQQLDLGPSRSYPAANELPAMSVASGEPAVQPSPQDAPPRVMRPTMTRNQRAADTAARVEHIRQETTKVLEEFVRAFTWEERKLIAAAAYHAEKLALAEKWGSLGGTQTPAVNVAARVLLVQHMSRTRLRTTGSMTTPTTRAISRHPSGGHFQNSHRLLATSQRKHGHVLG